MEVKCLLFAAYKTIINSFVKNQTLQKCVIIENECPLQSHCSEITSVNNLCVC